MAVRTVSRKKTATALGDAIVEAGLAAGLPIEQVAPKPKKPQRNHKKRGVEQRVGLGWEHDIANLSLMVDEGDCQPSQSDGPNIWAKLKLERYQPKELNVRLHLDQLEDDLLMYVVRSGDQVERTTAGNLPTLTIPVEWNKQGQPQMRKQDADNCDVILINQDGLGIQLQISVVVRSGFNHKTKKAWWAIYVQLQELQSLQVVTTTRAKASELGLTSIPTGNGGAVATVIPLLGCHNRPGTDWLSVKNSAKFGIEEIVPTCLQEGRVDQLSNACHEEWSPAELGEPNVSGKVRGIVSWYNMIFNGGYGFIEYGDGQSISVHWTQVRGGAHALQPMSVVEFFVGEHNGRPQAKAVVPV